MNREIVCQYHRNSPILYIDLLTDSDRILKCAKCFSSQKQEVNCLLIQDIVKCDEQTYFGNWPPISDVNLRQKVLNLKYENLNAEQQVIDFFDKLGFGIQKILSEKKKKSLIELQSIIDYKNKIIEEYCRMSKLIEMRDSINQEDKQIQEIENEIKSQISSQYDKQNEYTAILSYMIKKYEFFNQFNEKDLSFVEEILTDLFQNISFTPYYLFDSQKEEEKITFDKLEMKEKQLNDIKMTHLKIKNQIKHFIDQFDCFKEGIEKNVKEKLILDQFIEQQLDKLLYFQNQSIEALQNANLNTFQLCQKIMSQKDLVIDKMEQKKEQKYLKFTIQLYLQGYQLIRFDVDDVSSMKVGINTQGNFYTNYLNNNFDKSKMCYLNYKLDRNKDYTFKIKGSKGSSFTFGLYSPDFKNHKGYYRNQLLFDSYELFKELNQQNEGQQIIEFRVNIYHHFLQMTDFPQYTQKIKKKQCNQLSDDRRFYFCLIFSDRIFDRVEIFDIQESTLEKWRYE